MKKQFKIWLFVLAAGLLLIAAALVSCAPDTSAPELQTNATEVSTGDEVQSDSGADDSGSTGLEVAAAQVAFTDQACLDCHTNQPLLQELAVEEVVESISTGPG